MTLTDLAVEILEDSEGAGGGAGVDGSFLTGVNPGALVFPNGGSN